MPTQATDGVFDFTNVKDGGGVFNKKRQKEGDYKGKVTAVEDKVSKAGNKQWLFTIQVGIGQYPYYCGHNEDQLWKLRNLLIAAGMVVPKKRVKVNPNKLVGKVIAVTLEDDEYDGKAQSNVAATFPVSEMEDDSVPDEADDAEDDDEDDTPPPPKKKAKPAPVEEDDDDDEEEPPPPPKKKKPAPPVEEEDDDEEEAPAPPPAKKKKAPVPVDEDDLEEIDIDDT